MIERLAVDVWVAKFSVTSGKEGKDVENRKRTNFCPN